MNKRWVLKDAADDSIVQELSAALNINPVLSSLLVHRGITSFEDARYFFRPSQLHLHDPFLMQDMEKAIERIEQAIAKMKKF
jgi:single-stranded-DNA-specific exonuclease